MHSNSNNTAEMSAQSPAFTLQLLTALAKRSQLRVSWRLKGGNQEVRHDVIPSNAAAGWWLSLHKGCSYGPVFQGTAVPFNQTKAR